MNKPVSVADLFVKPAGWGLRGDPYLWEEMQAAAQQIPLPDTSEELEHILHNLFRELTGELPEADKIIRISRFPQIGMSGGMVSADFWLNQVFPAVIARFNNR